MVSLGTGTGESASSLSAPSFCHVIRDGFVPRLWRSFVSSLDGQNAWQDLWNRLNSQTREDFFRFNIYLSGSEPAIDDVQCMQELRRAARLPASHEEKCRRTAFALLAASLFFELDEMPMFLNGRCHCKGAIYSRLEGRLLCRALERLCEHRVSFTTPKELLGYMDPEHELCEECHRYQKSIRVLVRHLEDPFLILVQCSVNDVRPISGLPQSINWFMRRHKLFWCFPNSCPALNPCGACKSPMRGRSQKRQLVDDSVQGPRPKRARSNLGHSRSS